MRPKTTFYSARRLPTPVDEFWPRDTDALKALLLEEDAPRPRMIFGGGQHTRAALIGQRPFEAIRTDRLSRVLQLDRDSSLIRVEAGIRWGDLAETLRESGYSLQNYRPYPDAASLGGLLAKRSPRQPHWLSGDVRAGCVALSALSPSLGEYRYLEAPRKASGPDLRHLFMGGEGQLGAILDVTLHIQKPFPARLVSWEAPTARQAINYIQTLSAVGINPAWAYWKRSSTKLRAVFYAPTQLLDATVERLETNWLPRETAEHLPSPLIEGDAAAREFRRELQWDMPEQRSRAEAPQTAALTMSLASLADALEQLRGVEDIEILDWSAHAATAYIQFKPAPRAPDQDAHAAPSILARLSPEIRQQALAIRPIVDRLEPPGDEQPSGAPEWFQALKQQFDPEERLLSRSV